jgi:organic radical activating enzyme
VITQSEIGNPKSEIANGTLLPVMETFYSIQGEGFHSGAPAFFIRLGGCDVGCRWCDVKESWDAENHLVKTVDEIISEVKKFSPQKIIVTGGEPLMYDLTVLTAKLRDIIGKSLAIHLETSGAYPLSGEWDWICLSPKKLKSPLPEIYSQANELKVIIYNKDDFRFAEQTASCLMSHVGLYLQPEWSRRHKMLPLIAEYVKQNPRWKISLQTHKYMGVP